jgi:hypothetical protein
MNKNPKEYWNIFKSFKKKSNEQENMLYQKYYVKSVLIFQLPHQHHLDSQLYYLIQNQVFNFFIFSSDKASINNSFEVWVTLLTCQIMVLVLLIMLY